MGPSCKHKLCYAHCSHVERVVASVKQCVGLRTTRPAWKSLDRSGLSLHLLWIKHFSNDLLLIAKNAKKYQKNKLNSYW